MFLLVPLLLVIPITEELQIFVFILDNYEEDSNYYMINMLSIPTRGCFVWIFETLIHSTAWLVMRGFKKRECDIILFSYHYWSRK